MTFIVDDLLVRPFFGLLNVIHAMAIEGMYDTEALQDELKENRLLFELGELSEAEYEERRADIEQRLDVAEQAREQLSGRIEVRQ
ncbi:gas vesicle protein GvpG [Halomarina salina]|uniref:Gas vesicle protein GvpG n=1 Tax=Halomarina salina TaxID=1872699 RepID=A0ABD5RQW5_9EURY|nr:gas vesicle protein GvpG [Halomarina salina]